LAPERPAHADVINANNNLWKIAMDWNRVEGNWKQAKGKVKEKWGKLTDDDLTTVSSKARSRSATAWPKTWCAKTSTTG
jgi:hypothetical protein